MSHPQQAIEAENKRLKEQLHHLQGANHLQGIKSHSAQRLQHASGIGKTIFLLIALILFIALVWYYLSLF